MEVRLDGNVFVEWVPLRAGDHATDPVGWEKRPSELVLEGKAQQASHEGRVCSIQPIGFWNVSFGKEDTSPCLYLLGL